MKPADVARVRVKNSGLAGDGFASALDAVKAHCAMQAQDYAPAKWSLAQRTKGLVDSNVDGLLAAGDLVRTHVMRPTWHFVAADDLLWLLRLTGPRVQSSNASRYRELGLDEKSRAKAEKVIEKALSGGRTCTRKELAETLEKSKLSTEGQRLPHLVMHCELEGLICSAALTGKQHTYALVADRGITDDRTFDAGEATLELVRRYLSSHGPATVKDLGWWSGLTMTSLRAAIDELGDEVASEKAGELSFFFLASAAQAPEMGEEIQLLQTYDELIVGYTESRYFGDPHAAATRSMFMGAGASPHSVVLHGSKIAGYWRRTIAKASVTIDVRLYSKATKAVKGSLERRAAELGRFLGREPRLEVSLL